METSLTTRSASRASKNHPRPFAEDVEVEQEMLQRGMESLQAAGLPEAYISDVNSTIASKLSPSSRPLHLPSFPSTDEEAWAIQPTFLEASPDKQNVCYSPRRGVLRCRPRCPVHAVFVFLSTGCVGPRSDAALGSGRGGRRDLARLNLS